MNIINLQRKKAIKTFYNNTVNSKNISNEQENKKKLIQKFFLPNIQSLYDPGFHVFQKFETKKNSQKLNQIVGRKNESFSQFHKNKKESGLIKNENNISNIKKKDKYIVESLKSNKYTVNIIQTFNEYRKKQKLSKPKQISKIIANKSKVISSKPKSKRNILKWEYFLISFTLKQIIISGWLPQSRQGQSTIINNNILYIIMGFNGSTIKNICLIQISQNQFITRQISNKYNYLEYQCISNNKWKEIYLSQVSPRSYHTSVLYNKNTIVIIGGIQSHQECKRICTNKTCLYDISFNKFFSFKIQNQQQVRPRYKHSSVILGNYVIVAGGIDQLGNNLKDICIMDIQNHKWINLQNTDFLFGQNKICSSYLNEPKSGNLIPKQQYLWQGLYCFSVHEGLIFIKFMPEMKLIIKRIQTDISLKKMPLKGIVFHPTLMMIIVSFEKGFYATYYLNDKKWRVNQKNLGNININNNIIIGFGGKKNDLYCGGLRKLIITQE